MENKNTKLIFNPAIFRELVKSGCKVVDTKENRNVKNGTILVFERDEHFEKEFSRILKERADKKETKEIAE